MTEEVEKEGKVKKLIALIKSRDGKCQKCGSKHTHTEVEREKNGEKGKLPKPLTVIRVKHVSE